MTKNQIEKLVQQNSQSALDTLFAIAQKGESGCTNISS